MFKLKRILSIILFFLMIGSLNAEIIELGVIDTPGDANDVTVIGELAYIADSQAGLRIIDISNPEDPIEIGFYDTPGTALSVTISGDFAYIADGNSGMCIVDISDPENPNAIGAFQGQVIVNDVVVEGDYAYLADLIGGMRVIDISDPENPEQVGTCDTPDLPQGLSLSNQYIFIADRRSGLQIVDISNPEAPEIIGSIDTPGEANTVYVQDDYAYIADKAGGLRIIDISDPANPAEVSSYDTDGLAYDVIVTTHYVYIADGANGFLALNVTDPENPVLVGGLDTPGTSYGIDFAGGYVFVADGGSGLRIVQLTPEIVLSDEELDFGRVDIGDRSEMTLTISNEGHADLVISDVVVEGLYFGCDFDGGVVVDPGSEFELMVGFQPGWFGVCEGSLTVISDDPRIDEGVNLSGIGNNDCIEEKITANDAAEGDRFGCEVSICDDYTIVGAYRDDDNSGSAYIFNRDGDDWSQQAKLVADDAASGSFFGISVSISRDFAIAGAHGIGSAYIFIRNGEEWVQQTKLIADDADADDYFGSSASIINDYAIVGAYGNDDDGDNSGSAYIFFRDGDDWIQQAKLTANDGSRQDAFGRSVSIFGDYAISGAEGADSGSGAAYIYVRNGNRWSQQAKLTADDAAEGDLFGRSVSIRGNYAIVGAHGGDSAYIYVRNGNRWSQQAKLTADDAQAGDSFGFSVSIGSNYCIVGAYCNNDDGDNSGSAYIFIKDGEEWTQQSKLTADDADANDWFGRSVSIEENNEYAIVGAYRNTDNGEYSGSAYIYSINFQDRPEITINPDSLNFGGVVAGLDSELNLSISNGGEVNLQIFDIIVNSECFDVDFDGGFIIEPGGNEEVSVAFSPDNDRDYIGTLTIRSNDPLNQELLVELIGEGLFESRVHFNTGWNLISINTSPHQELYGDGEDRGPDVIRMMAQLRINEDSHHVLLMKNEDGRFYVPAMEFNNIPYWDLSEGYHVCVDADVEAVWAGDRIPADMNIPVEAGWNLISFYPTYELDASAPGFYALSPIINHVLLAKDNRGNFMAPSHNFSNMQPWRVTQGYGVKVDEEVVLNYPEMQEEMQSSPKPELLNPHWSEPVNTGNNMSVLVTSIADVPVCSGSQIAAFSSEKQIVGSGVIDEDGRCGLAVWGDDPETPGKDGLNPGEAFELRVWDAEKENEFAPEIDQFLAGKALVYEPDGLVVIDLKAQSQIPTEYYLASAFPNPFNSVTKIYYGLPETAHISIRIYDISGRLVTKLINETQTSGSFSVTWNARDVASGVYVLRLESSGRDFTRKIVLMR